MPLVVDDNIIRSLGHREVSAEPFIALRDEGGSIHVADGAAAELAQQLLSGRFLWEKWLVARDALRSFLDVAEPVLLGGRQGLYRAGIRQVTDEVSAAEIASAVKVTSGWWHSFMGVEQLGAITTPVQVGDSLHGLSPQATAREIATFKNDWIDIFDTDRIDAELLAAVQETMRGRGDPIEQLGVVVDQVAKDLDEKTKGQCGAPISVRLDAMIRVHVLLRLTSMRPRDPYDAEKHENDSFDHDLLRYLAYPAAICTLDRGIVRKMRRAKCWQTDWVVEPAQLMSAEARSRILEMGWPQPGS